jgi:hypothetical protein
MREISLLAEDLLASQEGICYLEGVSRTFEITSAGINLVV